MLGGHADLVCHRLAASVQAAATDSAIAVFVEGLARLADGVDPIDLLVGPFGEARGDPTGDGAEVFCGGLDSGSWRLLFRRSRSAMGGAIKYLSHRLPIGVSDFDMLAAFRAPVDWPVGSGLQIPLPLPGAMGL